MADTELLIQIARDIGELKGGVDALLRSQSAHTERLNSHSGRIGSLEHGRAWVHGAGAAVSAVVSAVVAAFSIKFS